MVEKVKAIWYQWIPGWLPIVLALCWIAMQYQRNNDRLDALEHQMKDVQEYLRTNHDKSGYMGPQSGVQSGQQPPEVGGGAWPQ